MQFCSPFSHNTSQHAHHTYTNTYILSSNQVTSPKFSCKFQSATTSRSPQYHQRPLWIHHPTANQPRHLHRRHTPALDLVHRKQQVAHLHLSANHAGLFDSVHDRHLPRFIVHDDPQLALRRPHHQPPQPPAVLLVRPVRRPVSSLVGGIVPEQIGVAGARSARDGRWIPRPETLPPHAVLEHALFGGDHAFRDGGVGPRLGGSDALPEVGIAEGADVVFALSRFDGPEVALRGGGVCGGLRGGLTECAVASGHRQCVLRRTLHFSRERFRGPPRRCLPFVYRHHGE
mmetsp:Transcript_3576/g.5847  ORF Transcript_3576/g.5847 Transcript_3576/m.5847 type:complete len:287 (+) Transcript_3576:189-1049(+)